MANYVGAGGPPPYAEYTPGNTRWRQYEHTPYTMDGEVDDQLLGTEYFTPPDTYQHEGRTFYLMEGVDDNFWYWQVWGRNTTNPGFMGEELYYRYNSVRWWGGDAEWFWGSGLPSRNFHLELALNYHVGDIGIMVYNPAGASADFDPWEWPITSPGMYVYGYGQDNRYYSGGGKSNIKRPLAFDRGIHRYSLVAGRQISGNKPGWFDIGIGYEGGLEFVTSPVWKGTTFMSLAVECYVPEDWFAGNKYDQWWDYPPGTDEEFFRDKRFWASIYFAPPEGAPPPVPGSLEIGGAREGMVRKQRKVVG